MISLGIESWYTPKWFRDTSFPFSTINLNYSVAWQQSAFLALLITWGGPPYFAMRKLDPGSPWWAEPTRMTRTSWIIANFGGSRLVSLIPEIVFWNRWLTRFTQQRWAASFYESHATETLLKIQDPSILITLPSHAPWFVIAIGLLFWAVVRGGSSKWSLWVASLLIMEPLLRLALEKIARKYKSRLRALWGSVRGEWLVTIYAFLLTFGIVGLSIRIGLETRRNWLLCLAAGFTLAYLVYIWLDRRNGYSRRLVDAGLKAFRKALASIG